MNYIELFNQVVMAIPEKTAIVDMGGNRNTSYSELNKRMGQTAGKLKALGCEKGSFIVINMGRTRDYAAAYLGIMKAGCVVVPTIPEYPAERIDYIKKHCGAKLIIRENFFDDIGDYEEFEDLAGDEDPMLLVYTSGSTGTPKGILHQVKSLGSLCVSKSEGYFKGLDSVSFASAAPMSFVVFLDEMAAVLLKHGAVHILDNPTRMNVKRLEEYYARHAISSGFIPPQMLKYFESKSPAFRRVIVGSERLSDCYSDKFEIFNAYGLSETLSGVCTFHVDRQYKNTPIGKPFDGIEICILDDDGNEVKQGEEGEICVVGDYGVSYYKMPELTAEKFIKTSDGKTLIHTGDIGYMDEKGNLVYSNRRDWMVKVNGQRVETMEIESLMLSMNELTGAAVKAFEDRNGQTYLVGYYVEKSPVKEEQIKEFLSAKLPDYMIPRFFVRLDAMPKNVNGKLDRKALKEPNLTDLAEVYAPPENELQQKLCDAFAKALDLERVGIHDDFIRLGGDSIKIVRLLQLLSDYDLSSRTIYLARTPEKLADCIANNQKHALKHHMDKSIPLTQTQLGIFFECEKREGEAAYNNPVFARFNDKVDLRRLAESIEQMVLAHPVLNAQIIVGSDGMPEMKYDPAYEKEPACTLEKMTERELEEQIPQLTQPFFIKKDRLFRIRLIETEKAQYIFTDFHHLIYDGTSMHIIVNDLNRAYRGEILEPETFTAFDIAVNELHDRKTVIYEQAKKWYLTEFADAEKTSLPEGDKKDSRVSFGEKNIRLDVSGAEIESFCKNNQITPNILTTAAFGYLLSSYNFEDFSTFATIYNGRQSSASDRTVSMLVKTLPVYCRIDKNMSVKEYLGKVKSQMLGAMANDIYSFVEVAAQTGITSDVMFVYQDDMHDITELCGVTLKNIQLDFNATGEALSAQIMKKEAGYDLKIQYHSSRYSDGFIETFAAAYNQVLNEMICKEDISAVTLLNKEEEKRILALSKGEELAYNTEETWLSMFKEQVQTQPDRLAVTDKNSGYSYLELDEASNKVANHLIQKGVNTDDFVAIRIGRVKEYIAACIGIQKAGAAFVPVDLSYPQDRINYMLIDSGAKVILTEDELKRVISSDISAASVDRSRSENRAYMIYTSGSTGMPKGVVLHQRGLLNFTKGIMHLFELTREDRISSHRSFSFDAHIGDFYPTLSAGASVHIMPEEIRKDIDLIYGFLNEHQITGGGYTTSIAKLLLTGFDLKQRFISCGGEALRDIKSDHIQIFNEYGPTECTDDAAVAKLEHGRYYESAPVGRPMINSCCFIVDRYNHLVPQGVKGEICYAGPQTGYGYWNQDEKTKEVFEACPFVDGLRMYHTGDVGCYDEEGNIEYTGRIDFQVKLNGFRIELGEIESKALQHPQIRQVSAQVRQSQICLYYTADGNVDEQALTGFLSASLAEYMVPKIYMRLEAMPLTPNGKINTRALPEPEMKAGVMAAPATELEQKLFEIICAQIGTDKLGVTTNLLGMGLSSLGVMRLSALIRQELGLTVKAADIMKNPTIRGIAGVLGEERAENTFSAYERREVYPITENQRGIFVEWEMNRDTTQYNIPSVVVFEHMDAEKLRCAVISTVDAHSYLKTGFVYQDGDIMQKRHDEEETVVGICRMESEPDADFFQTQVRPFDLFQDRLYRIAIFTFGDKVYLFMDMHHIVFDGLSGNVFMEDMMTAYHGGVLTPEKVTAYDLALYEQEQMQGEDYEKAQQYFDELIGDGTVGIYPDSQNPDGEKEGSVSALVPAKLVDTFCRNYGVTAGSFLQAAFAEALKRITGEDSPLYLTISNGRSVSTELLRCMGMFVKTLPVAVKSSGSMTVEAYVRSVHNQLQESCANEFYSYTKIVERHKLHAEIMFVYQGGFSETAAVDGTEQIVLGLDEVKFPISVNAYPNGDHYMVTFEYDGRRYSREDIRRFADAVGNAAIGFAAKKTVSEVTLLSSEEEKQVLALSRGEKLAYDQSRTWIDMFLMNVSENPENIAVVDRTGSYTYAELDQVSDSIAAYLYANGVAANDFAAIKMNRVKEFIAAVIGVHKAGAAYVPVDPEYPVERIVYMLEDSEAKVVLTEDVVGKAMAEFDGVQGMNRSVVSGLAYMIYTSGSTGRPKGVMQSHRSLNAFVNWRIHELGITAESRHAQHASFSFDASLDDLICPIAAGGEVHILDDELRKDMDGMVQYFEKHSITGTTLSTQLGMALLNAHPDMNLSFLMMGGEKMLPCAKTDVKIINGYGPTEFTVCSSCHVVDQSRDTDIPIGRPVPNTWSFICDIYGNLLPQGVRGELCLAGPQIAEGYWKHPDLTAEKFCECKFMAGTKLYRTGDLARYNEDGELEFLGRIDNQVKLRGFRIELGEIENRASQYVAVKMVSAQVKRDQLVLYYTAESEIDQAELRKFMAEVLTEYMVPSAYMQLEEMPLTPNGKINTKALPEPVFSGRAEYVEPETEEEKAVAEVMKKILGIENRIGALDNFFELGGDSIKAIRMVSLLREEGITLQVSEIMKEKTVRAIAAVSESRNTARISQEPFEGEIKNSAIICFFHDLSLPAKHHFNQSQLYKLRERGDLEKLQTVWNALTYQHDLLRAVVKNERLFVNKIDFEIKITEYSAENEEKVTEICGNLQSGFKMDEALVKVALIHETAADYLFVTAHHLIIDGVSWRIISSDLESAYGQLISGREIRLPAKTNTYHDYAEALYSYRDSYRLSLEIPYWERVQEKLMKLPVSEGKDYTRTFKGIRVELDEKATRAFTRANFGIFGADINDLLLTAVSRSFKNITGENSVSFQFEGHGREDIGEALVIDRTVGWFTSVYPVVVENITGSISKDISTVKETMHRVPSKGVGYNILRFIDGEAETNFSADHIAQIGFNYLGEIDGEQQADSFMKAAGIGTGASSSDENKFGPDLSINCIISDGRFGLELEYNTGKYTKETAEKFAEGILSEMQMIAEYLSVNREKVVTPTDLGENEWSIGEFEKVTEEFASRSEKLMRIYPLTSMQEGMLLKHVSEPESWAYRLVSIFECDRVFTKRQMENALERLGRKHEVLRTAIIHENVTVPRQAIIDRKLGLEMTDLSGEPDKEKAVRQLREGILTYGFDLQKKPLFSITAAKKDESSSYLIIAAHHAIVDGWCISLYMGDLMRYLGEEMTGNYTDEAEKPSAGSYEKAVREILGKDKKAGLNYWRELLDGYETRAEIPSYHEIPEEKQSETDELFFTVEESTTTKFAELCRSEGATVNNGTELAWGLVLQTYSRTEDAVFAKVVSGRDNTETDVNSVVGLFINSVPVRVKTEQDDTARTMLAKLQKQSAESNEYDFCPLSEIKQQTELGSQLFQTVIAFENYNSGSEKSADSGNLSFGIKPVMLKEENFDEVTPAMFVDDNGRLCIRITFNKAHYYEKEIERVGKLFCTFVKELTEKPDYVLSELSRMDAEDTETILRLSKGREFVYDETETWINLFLRNVSEAPDHIAVVDSRGSYTYQELDSASNKVANYLIQKGVNTDDFVAIKIGRVKEYVAACIGIQKAGAAFVPVDLSYPQDRIDYMISDSGASIVLTEDDLRRVIESDASAVPINRSRPENRAYMIYTSGSTGRPKGVVLHQRGLMNFTMGIMNLFELTGEDRISSHRSFSFDAHIGDFYPTLSAGASVHIMPEEIRKDIDLIYGFLNEHRITGGGYTTSIAKLLLTGFDLKQRFISCGGEALRDVKSDHVQIFNLYGPTECTNDIAVGKLVPGRYYESAPIGRPMINSYCFIVDGYGHLVPQGVKGEICYAGPQTGYGYWNLDEKTKEAFEECPFVDGLRMYHTGDVGYYNEDGDIEYTGRIDFQVKLNGFRIELGEIENKALQHPQIRQVSAQVRQSQICLYYTADGDVDEQALTGFLSASLAEYMVPKVYMRLEAMPLTPNGKINTRALPEPEMKAGVMAAPATELEQKLFEIICAQIGTDKLGVTTNLLGMGLSSLGVMRLSALIRHELGMTMKVADIMKNPTIRGIAGVLGEERGENTFSAYERREVYPVTENQRGIFVEWEMNRDTTQYNIPSVVVFEHMDAEKLRRAVISTVDAHSYLKTGFIYQDGDIMQKRHDEEETVVSICRMETEPDADFFQTLVRPFDLVRDRLYRIEIVTFEDKVYLFVDIHHIIFDGLSSEVFMEDMMTAYHGGVLTPEKVTAYDLALYEQEQMQGEDYEKAQQYFEELIGDGTVGIYPDSKNPDGEKEGSVSAYIPVDLVDAFCQNYSVTAGSFLQAAFAEALKRITGEEKPVYLTISNGRSASPQLLRCMGMFVKTLPVSIRSSSEMTAGVYVRSVHDQLQESYANEFYPYTKLVEKYRLHAEIMFVYQGGLHETAAADHAGQITLKLNEVKFPITVIAYPDGKQYALTFDYDGRRFSKEDIQCFADAVRNAAVSLGANNKICDVKLLSEEEERQILALSKGEDLAYDKSQTWIDLFLKNVSEEPEYTAVVDSTSRYTYGELDQASDSIAAYLTVNGVKENDFVAVKMDRVKEFIAAVIGINKIGAAYVPIDPEYPEERITYMLEDSEAKVLLTESAVKIAIEQYPDAEKMNHAKPDTYAYMIYTSGSTGKPKGVVIKNSAITACAAWNIPVFGLDRTKKNLHHPSFSFDASTFDLIYPLAAGGAVHILDSDMRKDLDRIVRYIKEEGITGMTMSTAVGMELLNQYDISLDYIMLGGEKFMPVNFTTTKLFNGYGPTEFTVCSSFHMVDQNKDTDIPIGRPVPNTWSFICDSSGNLLPQGIMGELCLAGPQIAEGYWKRPDLTEEKFCDCRFMPGTKMYRTGDLARYNEDGELEFAGRIDNQVKLRGFRIELGEIENRASQYEAVKMVSAQVKKDQLVLYFTADTEIDRKELRAFIAETLTEYMVPTGYMQLDEMPLTPNGKIDTKALPDFRPDDFEKVLPESEKESVLYDLAKEIIGNDHFGVTDDLMLAGMSSLAAMKFAAKLNSIGIKLKVSDIYKKRSIRSLMENHTALGYWLEEYDPHKRTAVLIHGVTSYKDMRPIAQRIIDSGYNLFAIEPVSDHIRIFEGEKRKEVVGLYTAYIDFLIPEEDKVDLFIGHSYGGELAFRCAAEWKRIRGYECNVIMLDTYVSLEADPPTENQRAEFKKVHLQSVDEIQERNRLGSMIGDLQDTVELPEYSGKTVLIKAMKPDALVSAVITEAEFMERAEDNQKKWRKYAADLSSYEVDADHYSMTASDHAGDIVEHALKLLSGV